MWNKTPYRMTPSAETQTMPQAGKHEEKIDPAFTCRYLVAVFQRLRHHVQRKFRAGHIQLFARQRDNIDQRTGHGQDARHDHLEAQDGPGCRVFEGRLSPDESAAHHRNESLDLRERALVLALSLSTTTDYATGAAYEYSPNKFYVTLMAVGAPDRSRTRCGLTS